MKTVFCSIMRAARKWRWVLVIVLLGITITVFILRRMPPYIVYKYAAEESFTFDESREWNQRQKMHNLDQGAYQLPVGILLSLRGNSEWGNSKEPTNADWKTAYTEDYLINRMQDFGFIMRNVSPDNEFGLPIGMVAEDKIGMKYTSMNCAVCHTGKIRVDGKAFIVDGAANMFRTVSWAKYVDSSIKATLHDKVELLKFAARLLRKKTIVGMGGENDGELIAQLEKLGEKATEYAANVNGDPMLYRKPVATTASDGKLNEDSKKMVLKDSKEYILVRSFFKIIDDTAEGKSVEDIYKSELNNEKNYLEKMYPSEFNNDTTLYDANEALFLCSTNAAGLENISNKSDVRAKLRSEKVPSFLRRILEIKGFLEFQLKFGNTILGIINAEGYTDSGPGRDDAWTTLMRLLCENDEETLHLNQMAPVKIPNLFAHAYYEKMKGSYADKAHTYRFHYDGNTTSMLQRNLLQALSLGGQRVMKDGVDVETKVDMMSLMFAEDYYKAITIPRFSDHFPEHFDSKLAKRGKQVFEREVSYAYVDSEGKSRTVKESCYSCHQSRPEGRDIALALIDTDRKRWNFFNQEEYRGGLKILSSKAHDLATATIRNMDNVSPSLQAASEAEKIWSYVSTGYFARPLNGAWASPPYLHNGSVSSIRDLLNHPDDRMNFFYLGTRNYDVKKLGYISEEKYYPFGAKRGRERTGHKVLATGINRGHEFGVDFEDADKAALIEYIKTLGEPEKR